MNEENKSNEIQGKNVLSWGVFGLGGFCLGGLCPGVFCPVTDLKDALLLKKSHTACNLNHTSKSREVPIQRITILSRNIVQFDLPLSKCFM